VMITVFCLSIIGFIVAGGLISWVDGEGTKPSWLAFLTMLCLIGASNCLSYYFGGM
jgi:uncharacterized protein (DUF983 family)